MPMKVAPRYGLWLSAVVKPDAWAKMRTRRCMAFVNPGVDGGMNVRNKERLNELS